MKLTSSFMSFISSLEIGKNVNRIIIL